MAQDPESRFGQEDSPEVSRRVLIVSILLSLLASIVLLVMVQMLVGLVWPPHLLLGFKGGH